MDQNKTLLENNALIEKALVGILGLPRATSNSRTVQDNVDPREDENVGKGMRIPEEPSADSPNEPAKTFDPIDQPDRKLVGDVRTELESTEVADTFQLNESGSVVFEPVTQEEINVGSDMIEILVDSLSDSEYVSTLEDQQTSSSPNTSSQFNVSQAGYETVDELENLNISPTFLSYCTDTNGSKSYMNDSSETIFSTEISRNGGISPEIGSTQTQVEVTSEEGNNPSCSSNCDSEFPTDTFIIDRLPDLQHVETKCEEKIGDDPMDSQNLLKSETLKSFYETNAHLIASDVEESDNSDTSLEVKVSPHKNQDLVDNDDDTDMPKLVAAAEIAPVKKIYANPPVLKPQVPAKCDVQPKPSVIGVVYPFNRATTPTKPVKFPSNSVSTQLEVNSNDIDTLDDTVEIRVRTRGNQQASFNVLVQKFPPVQIKQKVRTHFQSETFNYNSNEKTPVDENLIYSKHSKKVLENNLFFTGNAKTDDKSNFNSIHWYSVDTASNIKTNGSNSGMKVTFSSSMPELPVDDDKSEIQVVQPKSEKQQKTNCQRVQKFAGPRLRSHQRLDLTKEIPRVRTVAGRNASKTISTINKVKVDIKKNVSTIKFESAGGKINNLKVGKRKDAINMQSRCEDTNIVSKQSSIKSSSKSINNNKNTGSYNALQDFTPVSKINSLHHSFSESDLLKEHDYSATKKVSIQSRHNLLNEGNLLSSNNKGSSSIENSYSIDHMSSSKTHSDNLKVENTVVEKVNSADIRSLDSPLNAFASDSSIHSYIGLDAYNDMNDLLFDFGKLFDEESPTKNTTQTSPVLQKTNEVNGLSQEGRDGRLQLSTRFPQLTITPLLASNSSRKEEKINSENINVNSENTSLNEPNFTPPILPHSIGTKQASVLDISTYEKSNECNSSRFQSVSNENSQFPHSSVDLSISPLNASTLNDSSPSSVKNVRDSEFSTLHTSSTSPLPIASAVTNESSPLGVQKVSSLQTLESSSTECQIKVNSFFNGSHYLNGIPNEYVSTEKFPVSKPPLNRELALNIEGSSLISSSYCSKNNKVSGLQEYPSKKLSPTQSICPENKDISVDEPSETPSVTQALPVNLSLLKTNKDNEASIAGSKIVENPTIEVAPSMGNDVQDEVVQNNIIITSNPKQSDKLSFVKEQTHNDGLSSQSGTNQSKGESHLFTVDKTFNSIEKEIIAISKISEINLSVDDKEIHAKNEIEHAQISSGTGMKQCYKNDDLDAIDCEDSFINAVKMHNKKDRTVFTKDVQQSNTKDSPFNSEDLMVTKRFEDMCDSRLNSNQFVNEETTILVKRTKPSVILEDISGIKQLTSYPLEMGLQSDKESQKSFEELQISPEKQSEKISQEITNSTDKQLTQSQKSTLNSELQKISGELGELSENELMETTEIELPIRPKKLKTTSQQELATLTSEGKSSNIPEKLRVLTTRNEISINLMELGPLCKDFSKTTVEMGTPDSDLSIPDNLNKSPLKEMTEIPEVQEKSTEKDSPVIHEELGTPIRYENEVIPEELEASTEKKRITEEQRKGFKKETVRIPEALKFPSEWGSPINPKELETLIEEKSPNTLEKLKTLKVKECQKMSEEVETSTENELLAMYEEPEPSTGKEIAKTSEELGTTEKEIVQVPDLPEMSNEKDSSVIHSESSSSIQNEKIVINEESSTFLETEMAKVPTEVGTSAKLSIVRFSEELLRTSEELGASPEKDLPRSPEKLEMPIVNVLPMVPDERSVLINTKEEAELPSKLLTSVGTEMISSVSKEEKITSKGTSSIELVQQRRKTHQRGFIEHKSVKKQGMFRNKKGIKSKFVSKLKKDILKPHLINKIKRTKKGKHKNENICYSKSVSVNDSEKKPFLRKEPSSLNQDVSVALNSPTLKCSNSEKHSDVGSVPNEPFFSNINTSLSGFIGNESREDTTTLNSKAVSYLESPGPSKHDVHTQPEPVTNSNHKLCNQANKESIPTIRNIVSQSKSPLNECLISGKNSVQHSALGVNVNKQIVNPETTVKTDKPIPPLVNIKDFLNVNKKESLGGINNCSINESSSSSVMKRIHKFIGNSGDMVCKIYKDGAKSKSQNEMKPTFNPPPKDKPIPKISKIIRGSKCLSVPKEDCTKQSNISLNSEKSKLNKSQLRNKNNIASTETVSSKEKCLDTSLEKLSIKTNDFSPILNENIIETSLPPKTVVELKNENLSPGELKLIPTKNKTSISNDKLDKIDRLSISSTQSLPKEPTTPVVLPHPSPSKSINKSCSNSLEKISGLNESSVSSIEPNRLAKEAEGKAALPTEAKLGEKLSVEAFSKSTNISQSCENADLKNSLISSEGKKDFDESMEEENSSTNETVDPTKMKISNVGSSKLTIEIINVSEENDLSHPVDVYESSKPEILSKSKEKLKKESLTPARFLRLRTFAEKANKQAMFSPEECSNMEENGSPLENVSATLCSEEDAGLDSLLSSTQQPCLTTDTNISQLVKTNDLDETPVESSDFEDESSSERSSSRNESLEVSDSDSRGLLSTKNEHTSTSTWDLSVSSDANLHDSKSNSVESLKECETTLQQFKPVTLELSHQGYSVEYENTQMEKSTLAEGSTPKTSRCRRKNAHAQRKVKISKKVDWLQNCISDPTEISQDTHLNGNLNESHNIVETQSNQLESQLESNSKVQAFEKDNTFRYPSPSPSPGIKETNTIGEHVMVSSIEITKQLSVVEKENSFDAHTKSLLTSEPKTSVDDVENKLNEIANEDNFQLSRTNLQDNMSSTKDEHVESKPLDNNLLDKSITDNGDIQIKKTDIMDNIISNTVIQGRIEHSLTDSTSKTQFEIPNLNKITLESQSSKIMDTENAALKPISISDVTAERDINEGIKSESHLLTNSLDILIKQQSNNNNSILDKSLSAVAVIDNSLSSQNLKGTKENTSKEVNQELTSSLGHLDESQTELKTTLKQREFVENVTPSVECKDVSSDIRTSSDDGSLPLPPTNNVALMNDHASGIVFSGNGTTVVTICKSLISMENQKLSDNEKTEGTESIHLPQEPLHNTFTKQSSEIDNNSEAVIEHKGSYTSAKSIKQGMCSQLLSSVSHNQQFSEKENETPTVELVQNTEVDLDVKTVVAEGVPPSQPCDPSNEMTKNKLVSPHQELTSVPKSLGDVKHLDPVKENAKPMTSIIQEPSSMLDKSEFAGTGHTKDTTNPKSLTYVPPENSFVIISNDLLETDKIEDKNTLPQVPEMEPLSTLNSNCFSSIEKNSHIGQEQPLPNGDCIDVNVNNHLSVCTLGKIASLNPPALDLSVQHKPEESLNTDESKAISTEVVNTFPSQTEQPSDSTNAEPQIFAFPENNPQESNNEPAADIDQIKGKKILPPSPEISSQLELTLTVNPQRLSETEVIEGPKDELAVAMPKSDFPFTDVDTQMSTFTMTEDPATNSSAQTLTPQSKPQLLKADQPGADVPEIVTSCSITQDPPSMEDTIKDSKAEQISDSIDSYKPIHVPEKNNSISECIKDVGAQPTTSEQPSQTPIPMIVSKTKFTDSDRDNQPSTCPITEDILMISPPQIHPSTSTLSLNTVHPEAGISETTTSVFVSKEQEPSELKETFKSPCTKESSDTICTETAICVSQGNTSDVSIRDVISETSPSEDIKRFFPAKEQSLQVESSLSENTKHVFETGVTEKMPTRQNGEPHCMLESPMGISKTDLVDDENGETSICKMTKDITPMTISEDFSSKSKPSEPLHIDDQTGIPDTVVTDCEKISSTYECDSSKQAIAECVNELPESKIENKEHNLSIQTTISKKSLAILDATMKIDTQQPSDYTVTKPSFETSCPSENISVDVTSETFLQTAASGLPAPEKTSRAELPTNVEQFSEFENVNDLKTSISSSEIQSLKCMNSIQTSSSIVSEKTSESALSNLSPEPLFDETSCNIVSPSSEGSVNNEPSLLSPVQDSKNSKDNISISDSNDIHAFSDSLANESSFLTQITSYNYPVKCYKPKYAPRKSRPKPGLEQNKNLTNSSEKNNINGKEELAEIENGITTTSKLGFQNESSFVRNTNSSQNKNSKHKIIPENDESMSVPSSSKRRKIITKPEEPIITKSSRMVIENSNKASDEKESKSETSFENTGEAFMNEAKTKVFNKTNKKMLKRKSLDSKSEEPPVKRSLRSNLNNRPLEKCTSGDEILAKNNVSDDKSSNDSSKESGHSESLKEKDISSASIKTKDLTISVPNANSKNYIRKLMRKCGVRVTYIPLSSFNEISPNDTNSPKFGNYRAIYCKQSYLSKTKSNSNLSDSESDEEELKRYIMQKRKYRAQRIERAKISKHKNSLSVSQGSLNKNNKSNAILNKHNPVMECNGNQEVSVRYPIRAKLKPKSDTNLKITDNNSVPNNIPNQHSKDVIESTTSRNNRTEIIPPERLDADRLTIRKQEPPIISAHMSKPVSSSSKTGGGTDPIRGNTVLSQLPSNTINSDLSSHINIIPPQNETNSSLLRINRPAISNERNSYDITFNRFLDDNDSGEESECLLAFLPCLRHTLTTEIKDESFIGHCNCPNDGTSQLYYNNYRKKLRLLGRTSPHIFPSILSQSNKVPPQGFTNASQNIWPDSGSETSDTDSDVSGASPSTYESQPNYPSKNHEERKKRGNSKIGQCGEKCDGKCLLKWLKKPELFPARSLFPEEDEGALGLAEEVEAVLAVEQAPPDPSQPGPSGLCRPPPSLPSVQDPNTCTGRATCKCYDCQETSDEETGR